MTDEIQVVLKEPDAVLPQFQSEGAAAVDLHLYLTVPGVTLRPGMTYKARTGIAMWVENTNVALLVVPRSGLGSRGIVMANGTGVIDSDYQGELYVPLWNRTSEDISLLHGERIAQAFFVPILRPKFKVVSQFSNTTERGTGGFGSTG